MSGMFSNGSVAGYDDRRDVARRLRGARYGWRSWERALYDALGVDTETAGLDMLDRLADLIEPSGHECVPGECPLNVHYNDGLIDRDALLALVDELDRAPDGGTFLVSPFAHSVARRIREALGFI